jgi:large subunit ribosomal protein L10
MPNQKNKEAVEMLKEKVGKAKSIILAEYQGLKANDANALRAKMLENGAEVSVTKNTLLKIALKEEDYETDQISDQLEQTTLTVFAYEDPVSPLKALVEYAKKVELPKIKAGFIERRFASAEQLDVISKLPSREQLLGQVIGTMKSPITGLVNVFGGNQRKIVYALSAISKKKEGGVSNG